MLRRRASDPPPAPAWQQRFDRARLLIESQRPPAWIAGRLTDLERALAATDDDRQRLTAALSGLDVDRAGAELKEALRSPDPSDSHRQLVDSLRERYETIHGLINREADLATTIERSLADLDLLAARSVELGSSAERWELERTVGLLADDVRALELAHRELAEPGGRA